MKPLTWNLWILGCPRPPSPVPQESFWLMRNDVATRSTSCVNGWVIVKPEPSEAGFTVWPGSLCTGRPSDGTWPLAGGVNKGVPPARPHHLMPVLLSLALSPHVRLGSQDYENRSLDYVELHGETVACIKSYDLPTAAWLQGHPQSFFPERDRYYVSVPCELENPSRTPDRSWRAAEIEVASKGHLRAPANGPYGAADFGQSRVRSLKFLLAIRNFLTWTCKPSFG